MAETWRLPETSVKFRVEVSPLDHVVMVRRAAWFVRSVFVTHRRIEGHAVRTRVSVVARSDRRVDATGTQVWTVDQMDAVPEWLQSIVDRCKDGV